MQGIYSRPLRVYLLLGALALWGVYSGLNLSISLFPMSNQPTVNVRVSYGSYSSQQFFDSIGRELEPLLQGAKADGIPVDKITATYRDKQVKYEVTFDWGANPDEAVKAIQNVATAKLSRYEDAIRNSLDVNSWNSGGGSFFVSFYSPMRSLDEVYQILEPLVTPLASKIPDAGSFGLWNPNQKEITVRIAPERLAQNRLTTRQVESAITDSIFSFGGGTLQLGENEYQVSLPKKAITVDQLSLIRVSPVGHEPVLLKDIARIEVVVTQESSQKFRTSGVESLILFSMPKEGGNVKRMSDNIMQQLQATASQWPSDIQFNVLVNPSETINRSINGVMKEVGIAAFLAVLVLFFFIGSFRNVVTAAIEIPLSLLMAFILMKLVGMNLNLISLGGLALSAGMNVDASVVVLENIFRHFEGKAKGLSFEEKAKIVGEAVREVQLPIIASTLASLVVFLPLVFTRGLTNSLLGDLAKAVLFSHGLSAIVALILVPTIRLHLLKNGDISHGESRTEPLLRAMENRYGLLLRRFLSSGFAQVSAFVAVALALPFLLFIVAPNLKKEVIGKPESDWLIVGVNSPTFTTPKQMDSEVEILEADVVKNFGEDVLYTFSQINGTAQGNVMVRLRDRSRVEALIAKGEEIYKNTPTKFYYVVSWSPSELRIPESVDYRLEVTGGSSVRRQQVAHDVREILSDPSVYDNVQARPSTDIQKGLLVAPLLNLTSQPEVLSRYDLSHFLRVATDGVYVDKIFDRNASLPIYLRMPKERSTSVEGISSLPIGFDNKLVPVGALARVSIQEKEPQIYRENQQAMSLLEGKLKKVNSKLAPERLVKARSAVADYREKLASEKDPGKRAENPLIIEGQGDKVLQDALAQLSWAVLISVALIFLTMVLQLGDIVHSLLVLVAIPLGIIGVIVSLFLFGSTLSLNSGLGTILLNGIAVANSIILVDFIKKQSDAGMGALEAVLSASQARLRPILMTSLCTVLGMFPIALGHGEGGKTLQPLGIAVCGGLWLSMSLTIFLVPSLQYQYLRWKQRRSVVRRTSDQTVLGGELRT
jgi:hydrophobic/amphiphilic exporter-1 (mainly G- bacteria), HAE1 family